MITNKKGRIYINSPFSFDKLFTTQIIASYNPNSRPLQEPFTLYFSHIRTIFLENVFLKIRNYVLFYHFFSFF
ncbi:Uncharacterised protein [Capnocytophaga canimorsus]|nr:Uncharacterised protein [Capnocytophaga canimorsus]